MFKLNKSTHMLILMTFTIVFVVVYMYYTIKDVKKMYTEVKKHEQDIQNLQKLDGDIKEIKNVLSMIMGSGPVPDQIIMPHNATAVHYAPPPPQQHATSKQCNVPPPPPDSQMADDASIATEDIKKLVDDDDLIDEEPELVPQDDPKCATTVQESPNDMQVQSADDYTEEQLKKMKFDDLKDIAKKKNISIKGTRESLITRIMTEKNVS